MKQTMRVQLMSFNIRCFTKKDEGMTNWENRKEAVAAYLNRCDAAVICLQEVRQNQGEYLAQQVSGRYGVVYHVREEKENAEGLMTLYDREIFSLEEERLFWISQTPETMSIGWGAKCYRICVETLLRHRETGGLLNVLNVHLDHGDEDAPRVKGIRLVVDRAKEKNCPAVVAGDFNCRSDSLCYQTIAGEMTDCQASAPSTQQGVSFQRWGEIDDSDNTPIDFLFVSKDCARAQSFEIDREKWGDGFYYSDHYAVKAAVDFAVQGESNMKQIFVEGHRGYCALYPENTLLSFEKAIELGVDAFEFDIWLSKDKVPVLMHDGNPLRTCGVAGHLRDMTLEEIKQLDPCMAEKFGDTFRGKVQVPTFYELLELVKAKRPDLKLGVEIKEYTEETVDITVKALKEYGFFENCWFYAFNGRIIRYLKEKYNARTMGYPDFQMAEFCGYQWYDEIGLSMRIVRSEICDIYVQKGMPMHMYCADTEEDVRLCMEKGASLITANDPRALLKILRDPV